MVAKWTQTVNIFQKDFVIIPVCKSAHWTLLVVRMAEPREIWWLDSLGGTGSTAFEKIRSYLRSEYEQKVDKDEPNFATKEQFPACNPTVPRQSNNSDCGLYLLQFIEALIENADIFGEDRKFANAPRGTANFLFPEEVMDVISARATRKRKEIMEVIQDLRRERDLEPIQVSDDFHDLPAVEILSPLRSNDIEWTEECDLSTPRRTRSQSRSLRKQGSPAKRSALSLIFDFEDEDEDEDKNKDAQEAQKSLVKEPSDENEAAPVDGSCELDKATEIPASPTQNQIPEVGASGRLRSRKRDAASSPLRSAVASSVTKRHCTVVSKAMDSSD